MSQVVRSRNYDLGKRADDVLATRTRIIEAAMQLHGTVGPARTTISAVAELAGVRRNTLYRHFPTEDELFAAFSEHFWSLHPLPDPARWRQVEEPQCRFEEALSAVYAYYGESSDLLANLTRDAEFMPVVERSLEEYRALLESIAHIAGEDQPARATARHALEFGTWRSLVERGGLSDDVAVELMSALAFGTAGRPVTVVEPAPQQGKRDAVVRAAFAAFAEHGFRVSLDEIAERAGVSKVTIYSHFTSKEALFRTVITEQLDEAVAAARKLSSGDFDLRELCEACVDVLTSPAMANLHSVLEAEAKRFPDDTAAWLGRVPAELRRVLDTAVRALPGIHIPDPAAAVSQLYALCVQPGSPDVIESGVAMFLKFYETPPSAAPSKA
ncbi:TetR/AcrR family transcriptional regulator [Amycolatopsis sp. NPDC047767]|uniref:TetR/AcrR family transcriptional regulator n=1 Tax=Amycolatopsis sp. NPDC047767 TaxID=3156765 RepID=UPI0034557A4E